MLTVAVAPNEPDAMLVEAIRLAGGRLAEPEQARALVWTDWNDPSALGALLRRCPDVEWIQLTVSGVDVLSDALDDRHLWTSAKGAYARPMAEHVLAQILACRRGIPAYASADRWGERSGRNLFGARVTVLGGGGVTQALIPLLTPFEVEVTVVRANPRPWPGVKRVLGSDQVHQAIEDAEVLVLALALTKRTKGMIGAKELELLAPEACIVNVARGEHIVTEDLVTALKQGAISGAALDVTDPEPLPEGHELWSLPNCLITPHTACTIEMARPLLAERVRDNVQRRIAGQALIGVVDTDEGY